MKKLFMVLAATVICGACVVALKKVDTEGVKKLYLCESVGVPPERRA